MSYIKNIHITKINYAPVYKRRRETKPDNLQGGENSQVVEHQYYRACVGETRFCPPGIPSLCGMGKGSKHHKNGPAHSGKG